MSDSKPDKSGSIPGRGAVSGRRHLVGCVIHKNYFKFGPVEQRSARHPVTMEVVGSNPIRLAVDKQREKWYNMYMAYGDCGRCEKGEHGIESKYTPGHCACCGEEAEYEA